VEALLGAPLVTIKLVIVVTAVDAANQLVIGVGDVVKDVFKIDSVDIVVKNIRFLVELVELVELVVLEEGITTSQGL
jgi:hypothetical protein